MSSLHLRLSYYSQTGFSLDAISLYLINLKISTTKNRLTERKKNINEVNSVFFSDLDTDKMGEPKSKFKCKMLFLSTFLASCIWDIVQLTLKCCLYRLFLLKKLWILKTVSGKTYNTFHVRK